MKTKLKYFTITLGVLITLYIFYYSFLNFLLNKQYLSEEEKQWLQDNTITVVSQLNYAPFEFRDEDTRQKGMCIDLLHWISMEFGIQAQYKDMTFLEAQKEILKKDADIITSLFYSQERDVSFDFTKTIWNVPASIFVNSKRTDISTLAHLEGKRIAIQKGDYAKDFLESKGIHFKVKHASSFFDATKMVIDGEADAVIGDEQIVMYYLFKNKLTESIKKIGTPLYIGENCMAFIEGNHILQSIINKGIALANEKKVIKHIEEKWLGKQYIQDDWWKENGQRLISFMIVTAMIILLILFWNITLQKRLKMRAKEVMISEEKLRLAQSMAKIGNLEYFPETRLFSLGENLLPLLKMDDKSPSLSADEFFSKLLKEDKEKVKKAIENVITKKNIFTVDFTVQNDDKDPTYLSSILKPIVNSKNEIVTIFATVQDVTQYKEILHSLEHSNSYNEVLFLKSHNAIVVMDPETYEYIDCNDAAIKLYGYKNKRDVIGLTPLDVSAPFQENGHSSKEQAIEFINNAKRQKSSVFEWKHLRPNNEIWIAEVHLMSFQYDDKQLMQFTLNDITERKTIQRQLEKSYEDYRTTLTELQVGVVVYNKEGKIIYTNKLADKNFSLKNDKKQFEFLQLYKENDEKFSPDEYPSFAVLKTRKPIYNITAYFLRNNNEKVWITIGAAPTFTEEKEIDKIIVNFIDITKSYNAQLAILSNQRLGAIGEMTSSIAHDFNNSLQAILGNIELALIDIDETDKVCDYLTIIKSSALDASDRIKNLQKFGNTASNKESFKKLNLLKVIENGIAQAKPLWKDASDEKGIQIDVRIFVESDLIVMGNAGDLHSVIFNLIKNSIEAMPNGGKITFKSKRKKKKVVLVIQDDGVGMSSEVQKRIFQPFFTTKGFELGRGLGMSGVYSVIQQHGGKIEIAQSTIDNGSTFHIELPILNYEKESKIETQKKESLSAKIRVLWVDDEKMIQKMGLKFIKALGQEGDIASNGQEALEMLQKKKYDLVVTDIGMPIMNGWKLCEEIKKRDFQNMKVAILTGWGDLLDKQGLYEKGIDFSMSKPIEIKDLEAVFSKVCAEDVK